mgnify:CR=1 FL=1|tara:strand:- start:503 stop:1150 length:648 start_codon:yes stop_codon:yes gene_type:complete
MGDAMSRKLFQIITCAGLILSGTIALHANPEVAQPVTDAAVNSGGIMAMLSDFMAVMRGKTASTVMWWLNFFALLFLIYKFLFPFIFKMLEDNLTEIETILSAEEAEKRKLEERKVELQRSIDNIEGERSRLIEEATVQASNIKKEILTDARELEMRIFDNVEKNAAGYYYKKLNSLKNQIFGQVSHSFKNDHTKNPKAKARQAYDSNVIQKVGS